jgi:chemotaxis protein MotB
MATRGKRKIEDDSEVNIGLVLTVSIFLILLTFFILLNSIAVIDEKKTRVALGSLIGAFGSFTGGLSPIKLGKKDRVVPISPPMTDEKLTIDELLSNTGKDLSKQIKIELSDERDKITLGEDLLFEGKQGRLKPSSYPVLNKICGIIKRGDYQVDIIGHTDNRPAEEKGHKSNWELSSSMALKILSYFLKEGKISPKRLSAHGAACYRPIASNETRESRRLNNRIEIILDFDAATYVKRIYKKSPSGIFTYKRFNFNIFK